MQRATRIGGTPCGTVHAPGAAWQLRSCAFVAVARKQDTAGEAAEGPNQCLESTGDCSPALLLTLLRRHPNAAWSARRLTGRSTSRSARSEQRRWQALPAAAAERAEGATSRQARQPVAGRRCLGWCQTFNKGLGYQKQTARCTTGGNTNTVQCVYHSSGLGSLSTFSFCGQGGGWRSRFPPSSTSQAPCPRVLRVRQRPRR